MRYQENFTGVYEEKPTLKKHVNSILSKEKRGASRKLCVHFCMETYCDPFGVYREAAFIVKTISGCCLSSQIAMIDDTKKYPKEWKKFLIGYEKNQASI